MLCSVPSRLGVKKEQDKEAIERKDKNKKVLRKRKINSLKRQISIKEKMLEVMCFWLISPYFISVVGASMQ